MADILRFPIEKRITASGLRNHECEAVYAAACALIAQGRAIGVSIENDGRYVCVFDPHGTEYFIGRLDGKCYLFDQETFVLAESVRFELVLEALQSILWDGPANAAQEISLKGPGGSAH